MSERPILFSGPMVRAILDGRKTQTRRVVTRVAWNRHKLPYDAQTFMDINPAHREDPSDLCPYGHPGDMLWVRETWSPWADAETKALARRNMFQSAADLAPALYKADYMEGCPPSEVGGCDRWRPSIHMPRWASRLTLRITDVRVQRLQDISTEDAKAEGVEPNGVHASLCGDRCFRNEFAVLWNTINGKRYPWDSNPYVWAISFERQEVRR